MHVPSLFPLIAVLPLPYPIWYTLLQTAPQELTQNGDFESGVTRRGFSRDPYISIYSHGTKLGSMASGGFIPGH